MHKKQAINRLPGRKERGKVPAIRKTAEEAVRLIRSGSTVMVGGFGLSGAPLRLIDALERAGVRDLTVISDNIERRSLGKWVQAGMVKKAVGTYFTTNPDVVEAYHAGRIEVELLPQGTFCEAIRAGGSGIPAFYTPTSAGTDLAKGKEIRYFDGRPYVLERALRGDVSLIRAHKADELGNLVYYKTARNFNPLMAMASDWVIAEVDEIVPAGSLDPEAIVTPHVFVDILVTE
ncbi:MAG: CoA transferase subunit A [Planifilum fimeticola]